MAYWTNYRGNWWPNGLGIFGILEYLMVHWGYLMVYWGYLMVYWVLMEYWDIWWSIEILGYFDGLLAIWWSIEILRYWDIGILGYWSVWLLGYWLLWLNDDDRLIRRLGHIIWMFVGWSWASWQRTSYLDYWGSWTIGGVGLFVIGLVDYWNLLVGDWNTYWNLLMGDWFIIILVIAIDDLCWESLLDLFIDYLTHLGLSVSL